MKKNKLRIGILLDDYNIAAWTMQMLQNIIDSHYATIELIILNDNKQQTANSNLVAKLKNNKGRIISKTISKISELLYNKLVERNTYLPWCEELVSAEKLLANIPSIRVKTKQGKWTDYFYDNDLNTIRDYQPDILLRCGFGILKGDILNAATYGIWSYHHGDNHINRGGPAGYWESMESWPETGSILQVLTEDLDNGKVLHRSFSCTYPLSVKDNKSNYYWKSVSFMTRKMEQLYTQGEKEFFSKVEQDNKHPAFYSRKLYKHPTAIESARLTLRKVAEKTANFIQNKLFLEQWILMYDLKPELSSSLWRYKKIIPPKDRFWADPHILYKNNKYYVFIEEYLYQSQKGHISIMEIDNKGNHSVPKTILEKPYHLSYPFIIEHDKQLYMIPESLSNNTIELYKCVKFPDKWELVMNLMEGVMAVDATITFHNNKWWLFANMIEHPAASSWDELFLFSSDELLSQQWQPHPMNPIVSDCKNARPAGRIFSQNGVLYRPAQNSSVRYGYGFNLNEIIALNETSYTERQVAAIKPEWDKQILGTHTFSRAHHLHMIDAIYKRRK